MAQYKGAIASPAAAINWIDVIASGALADGESGEMFIRCDVATRVAVGVADPVASNTIGSLIPAGYAVAVTLGSAAAAQSVWVQTPADQSTVNVEVDAGGAAYAIAVYA